MQGLHRNQPLVVVHGQKRVKALGISRIKDRVGRKRPFDLDPRGARALDGGNDVAYLFPSERASFTGVGVQPADTNERLFEVEMFFKRGVGRADRPKNEIGIDRPAHLPQRNVARHQKDAQRPGNEHHADVPRAKRPGQKFRVAVKRRDNFPDRLFAHRGGDQR